MGLFGFDSSSTSSATDSRTAASDNATLNRGKDNISAKDKGKAVGKSGKLLEKGAADISANKGTINSGLQLTGESSIGSLTVNDTAPITDLSNKFADTLKTVTGQATDALSAALSAQSSTVSNALGKVSDLSASSQTGGDSDRNKIILYVVLGVLALLGVVFYVKK